MTEESQIQKVICDYLQIKENQKELVFWRENSLSGQLLNRYTNKQGQTRTYTSYVKNSKKGKPDIFVLKEGIAIFLEVKTAKGKQSKDQKIMQNVIERAGGLYHIVRCLDDVVRIVA